METPKYRNALIVGAGEGLSASLARLFAREGIGVALAARKIEKLGALCTETGSRIPRTAAMTSPSGSISSVSSIIVDPFGSVEYQS